MVEEPVKVALSAPDSVIDALLKVELPEVDPERAAEDAAAELHAEESAGRFSKKTAPTTTRSGEPFLTIEQATQRLGPKVMAILADKFNGSLTAVREPDEDDMLF